MEKLSDGLKKILLAGIGTVAVTAEKSKEVLDEMVKRGELTVEQGKVLNQELKHNIKSTIKNNVSACHDADDTDTDADDTVADDVDAVDAEVADDKSLDDKVD